MTLDEILAPLLGGGGAGEGGAGDLMALMRGSSAPLSVENLGQQQPQEQPQRSGMQSEAAGDETARRAAVPAAGVDTNGIFGGNTLAKLRTNQQKQRPQNAIGSAVSGMGGDQIRGNPNDKWLQFHNAFRSTIKEMNQQEALQEAARRQAARDARADALEQAKLALLGRGADRSDRTEARADRTEQRADRTEQRAGKNDETRAANDRRRLDIYEKHGGPKQKTALDAMEQTEKIIGLHRKEQREKLGLDADDEALPSQKLPPEERKKREAELEARTEQKRREAGEAAGYRPGQVPPAATPAAAGEWRRVRDRSTGAIREWNPTTNEFRDAAPAVNTEPAAPAAPAATPEAAAPLSSDAPAVMPVGPMGDASDSVPSLEELLSNYA